LERKAKKIQGQGLKRIADTDDTRPSGPGITSLAVAPRQ